MGVFDNHNSGNEHKGGALRQALEAARPELNLSADQEQKVKEIFKDFREERVDLKDEGGANMREDIRTARQEFKQKLMTILNDDQGKILHRHLKEL